MGDMPLIDHGKCDCCGLCVSVCRCKILVIIDGKLTIVHEERCGICSRWCTECEDVCPTGAISCPFDVIVE